MSGIDDVRKAVMKTADLVGGFRTHVASAPNPLAAVAPIKDPNEAYSAKAFYQRLAKWIIEFEASLDPEHEVGARLVSFGQTFVFHLENMSWWNPALIRFDGTDDSGQRVQLIQHVSQISVLLMAVPKRGDKADRIGFKLADHDDKAPPP